MKTMHILMRVLLILRVHTLADRIEDVLSGTSPVGCLACNGGGCTSGTYGLEPGLDCWKANLKSGASDAMQKQEGGMLAGYTVHMPSQDPEYNDGGSSTPWNHFVPTMVLMGGYCKEKHNKWEGEHSDIEGVKFVSSEVEGVVRIMPSDLLIRSASGDKPWTTGQRMQFNPSQSSENGVQMNLVRTEVGNDDSKLQCWLAHLLANEDVSLATIPIDNGCGGSCQKLDVKMTAAPKELKKGEFKFGTAGAMTGTNIGTKLATADAIVYEQVVSTTSLIKGKTAEDTVRFFGTGLSTSGSKLSEITATAKVESMKFTLPACGVDPTPDPAEVIEMKLEQKLRVGTYTEVNNLKEFMDTGEQDIQIEIAAYNSRPLWSGATGNNTEKATGFAYDMLHGCDQAPATCFKIKYIFALKETTTGAATALGAITTIATSEVTGMYFAYDPLVHGPEAKFGMSKLMIVIIVVGISLCCCCGACCVVCILMKRRRRKQSDVKGEGQTLGKDISPLTGT